MTSIVYPGFERNVLVYASDGVTARNVFGGSSNVASICEEAHFVLTAERGCGAGALTLGAANGSGVFWDDNPYLLQRGDVVYMVPEGTDPADAWYCGTVTLRNRALGPGRRLRHVYQLDGLAVRIQGVPVTEDPTAPLSFGTEAGSADDTHFPSRYYVHSGSSLGIVQWLAGETGPLADVEGLVRSGGFDYTGMTYSDDTKVRLMVLDHESDLGTLMFDLARQAVDVTAGRPCLWGVRPDRVLYFGLRPDSEAMALSWETDPSEPRGRAVVTIGGAPMLYGDVEPEEGAQFWNMLGLRGGLDANGDFVEGHYSNEASIAKYARRCASYMDVPHVRSANDAAAWAQGFFDRYADPGITYLIKNVPIVASDGLPFPWSGHCTVAANPGDDEEGGSRTIRAVTVRFNETPMADFMIGEAGSGDEGLFAAIDGNTRHPGVSFRRAMDRTPRAKTPGGLYSGYTGTSSSSTIPTHGHEGANDGGWGAIGLTE